MRADEWLLLVKFLEAEHRVAHILGGHCNRFNAQQQLTAVLAVDDAMPSINKACLAGKDGVERSTGDAIRGGAATAFALIHMDALQQLAMATAVSLSRVLQVEKRAQAAFK